MTTFHTVEVEEVKVFYRQYGAAGTPKLLLPGGFPSSWHQFPIDAGARRPVPPAGAKHVERRRVQRGHHAARDLLIGPVVRQWPTRSGTTLTTRSRQREPQPQSSACEIFF